MALVSLAVAARRLKSLVTPIQIDLEPGPDWLEIGGDEWRLKLPPALSVSTSTSQPHFVQFKREPHEFASDVLVERKVGTIPSDWMLWLQDLRASVHAIHHQAGCGFVFITKTRESAVYDFILNRKGTTWRVTLSIHDDLLDEATALTVASTLQA
ncbi:MAG: hypothetical protein AB7S38_00975 [Vulcanimicrobiota bacterium]